MLHTLHTPCVRLPIFPPAQILKVANTLLGQPTYMFVNNSQVYKLQNVKHELLVFIQLQYHILVPSKKIID
jgi:hypothetical protein